jgi:hypothetical protein
MGTSRRLLAISAVLLALAIAGCGGGDDEGSPAAAPVETTEAATLSREELLAQGDAICAEVNAAVGTVGSTSAAAGQAEQVAGLYGGMVERLQGLGAPSDDSAGYTEFIAAAEALTQAQDNVKLAAERGEGESEAEEEAASALTAFQSAATSFGLEQCAEAPAAPAPGGPGSAGGGEEESSGGVEEEAPEVAPEEEAEAAPEEVEPAPEAGGGIGGGGGAEGGSGGGSSGGIGPG